MAGDTLGRDFALRTVTGDAIRFRRHENVGRFMALGRVMTNVAIKWLLRRRIDLMLGVIKTGLRHPTID